MAKCKDCGVRKGVPKQCNHYGDGKVGGINYDECKLIKVSVNGGSRKYICYHCIQHYPAKRNADEGEDYITTSNEGCGCSN